jgi:glucuronate isomerase
VPDLAPDKALACTTSRCWNEWVDKLGAAADMTVDSSRRCARRCRSGTTSSTRRLPRVGSRAGADLRGAVHASARSERSSPRRARGKALSPDEIEKFRSALLYDFAVMDHRRGWVQQFHLGAMRNNSTRAMRALGPTPATTRSATSRRARRWSRFLDRLDAEGSWPRRSSTT